ncbi:hypothetical protein EWM64_g2768 [Hericium alpestre]|uniref:U1-type domain-containing protein n=1 Tax=Hericium alpestre TaxID=135208 RepID=A0A4Z0A4J3_9AGAM|nr:hypothetical protein EWM64_g2768 [Hericium alpestre]
MATTRKQPLKLDDFEREGGFFKCKVCPSSTEDPATWLSSRSIGNHAGTQKHQRYSKEHAERQEAARMRARRTAETATFTRLHQNDDDHPRPSDSMDCDPTLVEDNPANPAKPTMDTAPHASSFWDNVPDDLQWTDQDGCRVFFTAGQDLHDPLAQSFAHALRGAGHDAEKPMYSFFSDDWDDDESDDLDDVTEDSASAYDLYQKWFNSNDNQDASWFPYPDKALFLTDVLFNAPRLRFSRAQQKAVLSWAKELGATVPSYHAYHQCADALEKELGNPTRQETSTQGNVWYINEIGDSIAKDLANPISRPNMIFYPEYMDNAMKELSNGSKLLHDVPDELLTPSVKINGRIYYVGELVRRTQDRWFIPTRWLQRDGAMWALGYHVDETPEGKLRKSVDTQEHVLKQFMTALQPNVVTALEESAKQFGIKDPVAQPIIDSLVRLGQQLRKSTPDRAAYTPDEVQSILTEELKKAFAKGPVMNPLLDMNGLVLVFNLYFQFIDLYINRS